MLGKFTFSPLDVGALTTPRAAELQSVMKMLQPDAVVVPGDEGVAAVDVALEGHAKQGVAKVSLAPTVRRTGWVTLHELASQPLDEVLAARINAEAKYDDLDRTQLLYFTSGTTTGQPKGCPRTVRSVMHTIVTQTWGSQNDNSARNLLQTANFRIVAPGVAIGTWSKGGCVVMPGLTFSPSGMLEAIERYKIRMILFIPAMVHALNAHPDFDKIDWSGLCTIFLGGDIITEGIYQKTCAAFPGCEVINAYGSTEGGSAFTYETEGKPGLQPIPFYAGISPVGKVNQGTRIRIANDQNRPVKRGEVGELHFCSPSFVTHYLNNEKPEDFYTDEHGSWFRSGDTGMINSDGWVYVLGRQKDIVKRAGIPITPAALESCIDTFLQSQSSVVALPHEQLGQEAFAVVKSLNGKSKDDVRKQVEDLFGKDYVLCGFATLEELGLQEFPLNATGKIVKRELEGLIATFLAGTVTEK